MVAIFIVERKRTKEPIDDSCSFELISLGSRYNDITPRSSQCFYLKVYG
jgi:hypothetical protein